MTHNTPPFVSGRIPGLGHAWEFYRDQPGLLQRGYKEHGRIFAIKLANQNVAVVIGPENQKIFFTETDKALNIQEPYRFLRAMFGDVLFLAPHEEYIRQRPFIQEMFKRDKMLHYMEVMQEVVQSWLDSLDTKGEIELTGEIGRLVQEVAGNCFLGPEVHQAIGREFWDLYTDIGKALDPLLPPNLPLPKFRRRDRAKRQMIEILRPVIAERRQHPERYDDFLQDLVNKKDEHGQEASEELILNMLIAFMFAGHETTAGQAAWTIILLLQHPEMLRRVLDEMEQAGVMTGAIDHRQLAQLQNLAWTVREVERLRPSAELLLRTVKEDIEFEGYLVPAGWLVQVSQGISHRLPDHFEQPEQFDPLRYAPEQAEDKQHRFALFGFGGGIHKCTGMNFANTEMMIITTLLLRKFELTLLTPEPGIERSLGASRPEKTMVRYRRLVQSRKIGPIYSTP